MAVVIYRGVHGQPIEKFLAVKDGVQFYLERTAWEIGVRAEASLVEHKHDGHAKIIHQVEGAVDHFVILDDEAGYDGAMSMEFGRAGYIDPRTGLVVNAMEPLYILTDAANLPRKRKRLPALKRYDVLLKKWGKLGPVKRNKRKRRRRSSL